MALIIDVLEFNNFVSFVVEEGNEVVSIQYQAGKVWRDEGDVWHVARDAMPSHISRQPVADKPKLKVSDGLMDALTETLAHKE